MRVLIPVFAESIVRNSFRFRGLGRFFKWLDFAEEHHLKSPHYYIDFFAVEPSFQNRGVGSSILDHVTRVADQEQTSCYLDSTNHRNLSLYQRFGFQVRSEGNVVVPTWFLERPPA